MKYFRPLSIIFLCATLGACAAVPVQKATTGKGQYIITLKVPVGNATGMPSDSDRSYLLNDRWRLPISTRRQIRLLVRDYHLKVIDTWPLKSIGEFCLVVGDPGRHLDALSHDARVASVEQINQFVAMGDLSASPRRSFPFNNRPAMDRMHHWATGKGIRVGIIDTPIDLAHPALKQQVRAEAVFIGARPRLVDLVHGTAVTGIIAASRQVGFAPDAQLHIYGACHFQTALNKTVCNTFSLAKAIEAAVADRLDVVNISLAGPYDPLLARQINALMDTGAIVVAADNPDSDSRRFPAMLHKVISATVPGDKRRLSPAPIRVEDEHFSTQAGGGYQFFYGSSMSAARITGLITLLLQRSPGLSANAARQALGDISRQCNQVPPRAACTLKFALAEGLSPETINQVKR